MTVEWTGPVLAAVTVVTIGLGHVMVRKANYLFGTVPAIPLFFLGAGILTASFFMSSDLASAVLGIVGVTTVWDGVEVIRQENRIRRGHAPQNPKRPVTRSAGSPRSR